MSQKLQRAADVLAAPIEDTMLLLNVTKGQYHSLNPVAARIWELLAEPIDEAGLVEVLRAEFAVAPEVCQAEVATYLAALRDRGLLVVA